MREVKRYIEAVQLYKIWVCIVIAVLAVVLVGGVCCCLCRSKTADCSSDVYLNIEWPTGVCLTKERQEQMQAQMQKQISESLKAVMENNKENNNICKTLKNCICYDPFCCFLFVLALLCVAGGLVVICVLHCSAIRKQALLTYAYDKALDSLEEVKDTDELDGSIEVEELQNNNQNNNIIKTTQSKHKDYKKTITEIFQAYCQNITAK